MSKTNITIVAALLAIIGTVSGLAVAFTTTASTSVSGPLGASFQILTLPSESIAFPSAVPYTETFTDPDSLTVRANKAWQLHVSGDHLAITLPYAYSAEKAMKVYAGESTPIYIAELGPDSGQATQIDSGSDKTGNDGVTVHVKYGQIFTFNDPASVEKSPYTTSVAYELVMA